MPTNTDLVSQLPADFEVFGQAVDTSLADLKGGTTGQILSKTSNTDMDFTWITSSGDIEGVTAGTGISGGGTSGTVTITNSMATAITTKGDLIVGTGSGTFQRQGVGANGTVLMADSAEADGVKWATPSSGAVVQVKSVFYNTNTTTSSTSYVDTGITLAITPTSASNKILVMVSAAIYTTKSGSQTLGNTRLDRSGTVLYTDAVMPYIVFGGTGTKEANMRITQVYLDSPATTSAITYKLQMAAESGGSMHVNTYSGGSTLTLLEVTP